MPEKAHKAGAAIVATGRSDFPNQVNNVLAFPGFFKGALKHGVTKVTSKIKLNAAYAIARTVKSPTAEKILPSVFDKNLAINVSKAIK
jgi:malate dehydrogenase (oxaloacetate-decarboxylating)